MKKKAEARDASARRCRSEVQETGFLGAAGRAPEAAEIWTEGERLITSSAERECRDCLLRAGMQGVRIHEDGRCNFCRDYLSRVREAMAALPFFRTDTGYVSTKASRCLVAFSGGGDSAKVLVFVRKYLRAKTTAVLFNNGFIPQQVILRGKKLAETLGASWIEIGEDMSDQFRAYFRDGSPPLPCQGCSSRLFKAIASVCRSEGCEYVFTGHWGPSLVRPLSDFSSAPADEQITVTSPLPAIRQHWRGLQEALARADWQESAVPGNTTNCEIEPFFEHAYFRRFGYNPAIADLSDQVRAGWIDKAEAARRLGLPQLTHQLVDSVSSRLSLPMADHVVGL